MLKLVAKRPSYGIPVLYLPFKLKEQIWGDDIQKTESEKLLSSLIIKSKSDNINNSIIIHDHYIDLPYIFFEKICRYVDLFEIVSKITDTRRNTFIFYNLLEYAYYQLYINNFDTKDIKLISLLIEKIAKSNLVDAASIIPILDSLYKQGIKINIPKEYSDRLIDCCLGLNHYSKIEKIMYNIDFQNYILDCIGELDISTVVGIVFNNRVYFIINHYEKLKDYDLLLYALRYEMSEILEFLYTKEKPIKCYINETFLIENGIDPESIKFTEEIINDNNFEFIEKLYLNTSDIDYLNKRMMLFLAVKNNNYELTKFLIEKGCKIDMFSCNFACYNGSLEILELLIDNGADIDIVSIYYAAFSGKFEILKYLYKKKYNFTYDVLEYLISAGHLNLKSLKSIENIIEPMKDHIMKYVCERQDTDIDIMEYLYENNAKIEPKFMDNISRRGSLSAFKFLMSKGLPINQEMIGNLATRGQIGLIRGFYDKTVPIISLTGKLGDKSITRFFNRNRKELDYNTISKGIHYGNFEIRQSFTIDRLSLTDVNIDAIAFSNECTVIDCTIYNQLPPIDEGTIQTAARHRHIDLLRFLIERKAPIDEDAMYDAIVRGFTDVVILLYSYYPLVNNYHILLAKLWNRYDILTFFKDKKIEKQSIIHAEYDINEFSYLNKYNCHYLLYYACEHGNLEILKQFFIKSKILGTNLKIKPYANMWNDNRYSHDHLDMLYVAILNGQMEIVKYLENIIKNDSKNDSKYTACATRIGRIDMLKYLVNNGYLVSENSMKNAIEKGRFDFVRYLISINSPIPENALKLSKIYNSDEIYNYLNDYLKIK